MNRPRSLARLCALAAVLVVVAPAVAAAVAPTGKRIAVLPPAGGGNVGKKKDAAAGKLGARIAAVLKQHKIRVLPAGPLKKAMRKQGVPSTEADWTKLARRLKVDGFVESTLSKDGGKREIEVRVRSGADGAVAGQETFAAKGPPKKLVTVVGASFWKKLGPAIRQTSAPTREAGGGLPPRDLPAEPASKPPPGATETAPRTPEPAAAAAAVPPPPPAKAAAEPEPVERSPVPGARDDEPADKVDVAPGRAAATTTGSLPALEVEADLRVLRRVFEYVPSSAARNYVLNFYTPVLGGRAAWFPIRYLGVFAAGESSLVLKTGQYPTSTQDLMGGVQFRMPFWFGQVGASAAYFRHSFLVRDTPDPNDVSRLSLQVPNTVYVGARFGASARFRISDHMQAGAEFAYRLVTSAGQDVGQVKSEQYFPMSASPVAIDLGAFFGYRVGSLLEVRGGVDYRRYAFGRLQGTLVDGTVIDATGALDQYVAFFVGAAGVFGSK